MSDVVALLRRLVQLEMERYIPSHIGVVEAVKSHAGAEDNTNYACDVKLRGRDLILYDVPISTPHLGSVAPPAKGDVVLIHFVGGDADFPIVGGSLYSDQLRPPAYGQGQIVLQLPPSAEESDRLDLIMKGGQAGSRSWELKLPDKVSLSVQDEQIVLTAGQLKLTLNAEAGKASLETGSATITADGDGNIAMSGNASIKLKTDGNVDIQSGGNLSLTATGELQLKGSMIKLN